MKTASHATPWAWALGGAVLGLLCATVWFAPARWLASAVDHISHQQVALQNPEGSVWSGSAQLVFSAGNGSTERTALPERLHWRLRPSTQGITLALRAPCCLAQDWVWTATPLGTGVQLQLADHQSQWPSALLAGLGTPWNTIQLQGLLALSSQGVHLQWSGGNWTVAGHAQLDALDISTRLSTLRPVGSYRLLLDGGATPSLQLQTLQGSLNLSGHGQWVGGRLHFEGAATAAEQYLDALTNLLNIIGRRNGARSVITVG